MDRAARALRAYARLVGTGGGPAGLQPVCRQLHLQSRHGCRALSTASTEGEAGAPYDLALLARRVLCGLLLGGLAAAAPQWPRRWERGWALAEAAPATEALAKEDEDGVTTLTNWSGTHECRTRRFLEPETVEELEAAVAQAHAEGRKLRCVGSALSPNGLAFCGEGMVSVALLDEILSVDAATGRVRVQAGARVADVVERLRPHGLTLQNFASIREQSIGGFAQVSAHGTGASIPPVDEQVVGMRLVTPAEGTLDLSLERDPDLFRMARVGLGCLGVVAEVELQCVRAHRLLEHTFVTSHQDVERRHAQLLADNRHLRYMWIPYTDRVIVVTNNPLPEGEEAPKAEAAWTEAQRREPLRALLEEAQPAQGPEARAERDGWSGTRLRDKLIALAPLDAPWIARVNQAEAAFWERSQGYRAGWSDEILGFDCGGQQLVLEVAFPCGTLQEPSGADLAFMRETLALIEREGIPAPAPIEQRWTASSASPMSPAGVREGVGAGTVHSWVGIIHYLPSEEAATRAAITASFRRYYRSLQAEVMPRHGAAEHWAKIEAGCGDPGATAARLGRRYPVGAFTALRRRLDPRNVLGNALVDELFPLG